MSPEAKQVCTKALLNFVAEDTLPILIDVSATLLSEELLVQVGMLIFTACALPYFMLRKVLTTIHLDREIAVMCRNIISLVYGVYTFGDATGLSHTRAPQEGIIAVVTNLSKLNDEESMRACATVLALLSTNAQGRAKIAERTSSLVSLFELLRSEDQGTQVICGKVNMPTQRYRYGSDCQEYITKMVYNKNRQPRADSGPRWKSRHL